MVHIRVEQRQRSKNIQNKFYGDVMAHLQRTTEAVVPGSNPTPLTVNIFRGQAESLCILCTVTVKSRGREGNVPLRQKIEWKKITKYIRK